VAFCINLLANVLHELNILYKIFQIENVDLTQLGAQIELTMRFLMHMFLNVENFGADSKYLKAFMDVGDGGIIQYRDLTGTIHTHYLLFDEIPGYGDLDGSFNACKDLAWEYVQRIIDSLYSSFFDIWIFNATKVFSPISYSIHPPLLYSNAQLWLQILLYHFCLGGAGFEDLMKVSQN
jgi:hypothetical protein